MSKTKRAYKYRFYPTDEQKRILAQTFGCCRFVYNWGLSTRKTAYFQHGQKLSYNDLSAMLPSLKKEHPWLSDVSSVPVQQSLRHLDRAYKNFFEGRAKYPTFKKRRNTQSATYASNAFTIGSDGQLTLAKMDQPLVITFHRAFPKGCKPSSVTISKDCADRYFVSMLALEEIKPLPETSAQVGLGLGIKSMVILSTGEAVGNPKFYARDEKKLAKAQRRHAKKKKGSKNREKARQMSTQLINSAHNHNLVMQSANQLSHQLPSEPDLGTRISQVGINWSSVGENIGYSTDYLDPIDVAPGLDQDMLNEQPPDDGHRQNILSKDFTTIGIDVFIDTTNYKVWLTEDFAHPV